MHRKKSLTARLSFRPLHLGLLFLLVIVALFTPHGSFKTTAAGPAPQDPSFVGAWSPVTTLNSITSGAIVAIHTNLLPNGKVLVFTRQQGPDGNDNVNGFSRTYVWDPSTGTVVSEAFNSTTNLFCSGHAFIHDGRLLVTGGHLGADGRGEPDANFYDWVTGAWSSAASMGRGRWYPTNVILGNSEMLVDAGFDENGAFNNQPQVWQTNNTWRTDGTRPARQHIPVAAPRAQRTSLPLRPRRRH